MTNTVLRRGEYMDDPKNYKKDSCYFCKQFTSYADEYDDDLAPADMGRCERHYWKQVDYEDHCNNFWN